MYGLVIKNDTEYTVSLFDKKGTDWIMSTDGSIGPGQQIIFGGISWTPRLHTDHWGWVFFELNDAKKTRGQCYMSAGSERGLYDYCVQAYDGGESRNGDTVPYTKAELLGAFDGCTLTLLRGYGA